MKGIAKPQSRRKRWGGAIALILMVFGAPNVGLGQQGGPGIGEITYPDGNVEVFMQDAQEVAAQAASSHIFQTRPAIRTSTKHFGEQITRQTWMCIRFDTGQIVPNSDITMTLSRDLYSGGHDHDDAARDDHLGEYTPSSFNTGPTGISDPVEYKADEVSGVVNLRVDCTFPPGSGVFPGFSLFTIGVEFPNLVEIPADPAYNLVGSTSTHASNHWVRAGFIPKLKTAAEAFNLSPVSGATKFEYNDASLPQGGLFDIKDNWKPPRCTHRVGENVDFRIIHLTGKQKIEAEKILTSKGMNVHSEPSPPHWHLTDATLNFSNFSGVGQPPSPDVCANST